MKVDVYWREEYGGSHARTIRKIKNFEWNKDNRTWTVHTKDNEHVVVDADYFNIKTII